MRIVLLVPKIHGPAELAVNHLLSRKDLDIVGVVRSDLSPFTTAYWKYLRFGLRKAGVFYGFLIGISFYWHLVGFAIAGLLFWRRRRKWRSLDDLIERHGLMVHDTEDINSEETLQVMQSWDIDVMVSVYFDQILKKPAIEVAKVAALNMHPGKLPRYRGLWPEFWTMYHGEKSSGITIHHLDEKIDTGAVVAQSEFKIQKKESKLSLSLRGARYGAKLMVKVLRKLKRGVPLRTIQVKGKGQYFSLPDKKAFEQFFAKGGRLLGWEGIL